MASKHKKDEISAESYRKAYHAAQSELVALRAAIAAQQAPTVDLVEEMAHQLEKAPGYYRIGRSSAGMVWVRWKWTQGDHAGCYQIGGGATLYEALLSCNAAVDGVERGRREALLDVPYKKRT